MIKFDLRFLFVLTTVVCVMFAAALPEYQSLRLAASVMIVANVLSAIVAILITFGFGVPRDGGYRYDDQDEEPTLEPTDVKD